MPTTDRFDHLAAKLAPCNYPPPMVCIYERDGLTPARHEHNHRCSTRLQPQIADALRRAYAEGRNTPAPIDVIATDVDPFAARLLNLGDLVHLKHLLDDALTATCRIQHALPRDDTTTLYEWLHTCLRGIRETAFDGLDLWAYGNHITPKPHP